MKGKKACKNCKIMVEGDKCSICQGSEFTETPKGRIIAIKPAESEIAKNLKITREGDYAIKTK